MLTLTITGQELVERGACEDEIEAFRAQWGERLCVELTPLAQVWATVAWPRAQYLWARREGLIPPPYLTRANLTRANLTRANLTRANLSGAILSSAATAPAGWIATARECGCCVTLARAVSS